MRFLSICSMLKDEPDLVEWVSYHRAIGVEHFWLFDNGSKVPIAQTLSPLVDRGIVEVIVLPGFNMQALAFDQCARLHAAGKTEWLACIDGDEYLWISPACDGVKTLLYELDGPGIVLNWCMFGHNGREKRASGLAIESYLSRAADDYPLHQFCKSIVRPDRVRHFSNSHFPFYKDDAPAVNTARQPVWGPFSWVHFNIARVNHYVTKSRQEYCAKIPKLRPDGSYRDVPFSHYAIHCNAVEDWDILRFTEKTKTLMGEVL